MGRAPSLQWILFSRLLSPLARFPDSRRRTSGQDKFSLSRARPQIPSRLEHPTERPPSARIADGVGDCHSRKAGRDQIENHADAPDESAEQSERVAGNGSSEKTGKTHGLSNERVFH